VCGGGGVLCVLVHVEQAGVRRVCGGAGARPHVRFLVLVGKAGVPGVRGGGGAGARPCVHLVPGGGAAGGVGDTVHTAALSQGALGCVEWAGDRAGGHLGRLQWVCGRLCGQLVQLGDYHSLGRLGHKLVLVGVVEVVAELVQLAWAQLAHLHLGVGAQDCDCFGGWHRHQLVQLRLAQLPKLQLDVQAYHGGVGG
jgi:hypothetical protein